MCQADRKVQLLYYSPVSSLQPTLQISTSVFSDESEIRVGGAPLSFRLHRLGKQRRKVNVRTSHLEPEPSRAFMSSQNKK